MTSGAPTPKYLPPIATGAAAASAHGRRISHHFYPSRIVANGGETASGRARRYDVRLTMVRSEDLRSRLIAAVSGGAAAERFGVSAAKRRERLIIGRSLVITSSRFALLLLQM